MTHTLLEYENIDVLLVSNSHFTLNHNTILKIYSIYSSSHPDGTAHAGTAIIIRKHIKHEIFPEYKNRANASNYNNHFTQRPKNGKKHR